MDWDREAGQQQSQSRTPRRESLLSGISLALVGAAGAVFALQLLAAVRGVWVASVAQKTLLREVLAEIRGYSANAAEAFERAMAEAVATEEAGE